MRQSQELESKIRLPGIKEGRSRTGLRQKQGWDRSGTMPGAGRVEVRVRQKQGKHRETENT